MLFISILQIVIYSNFLFASYECIGDARLRCDLVDLYYTLFGIRKPLCFLDDSQQNDEAFSRRKSALTTREGVEEFKRVRVYILIVISNKFNLQVFSAR